MSNANTEGIIRIDPFEIEELTNLTITNRINDHARATFTGVLKAGDKAKKQAQVFETEADTQIKITHVKSKEVLFVGIATKVEVRQVHQNVFQIECEAISYTYQMDIKLRKRSFQKKDMQYSTLLTEAVSDKELYKKGVEHGVTSRNIDNQIEQFILQYNETDWEFLKRIASQIPFHTVLVADQTSPKPKFNFGLLKDDARELTLKNSSFTVRKAVSQFRERQTNHLPDLAEDDFICYEVFAHTFVPTGCKIKYDEKTLYVYETCTTLKEGTQYIHHYHLMPENAFKQGPVLNNQIIGLSLPATVRKIENDHLQVELLKIEHKFKLSEALSFPYSTFYSAEGHTGWYCMPQVKDQVQLYFPTATEAEAVVINSIRQKDKSNHDQPKSKDKITDPDVKIFRTNFGKELLFNKNEIIITGKDKSNEEGVLIRISDQDGIEIFSDMDVKIYAKSKLSLESKTVEVTAGTELKMLCGKSSLHMKDGSTHLKGSRTRNN